MFALRDFKFYDRESKRSVDVKQGQAIDGEFLSKHKCDVEKLERTKFVASGEAPSTGYKKRGRPKKSQ